MYHENAFDEITDYLYLGSRKALQNCGDEFSMIVNCTRDIGFPKNCEKCIRIPIDDDPYSNNKILKYMEETNVLEKMRECIVNKEPVLVHCFAGMQRSCTIVACYLIKYCKLSPKEAILYIQKKRPNAFFGEIHFLSVINNFHNKLQK